MAKKEEGVKWLRTKQARRKKKKDKGRNERRERGRGRKEEAGKEGRDGIVPNSSKKVHFLHFYFSLQKIGENKVTDKRIKGLKGNHMNVIQIKK